MDSNYSASGLAQRLRRAARTGRRLHLHPSHVAILMNVEIYGAIAALEAQEIRRPCAETVSNDNNVGTIGFGNAQTPGRGSSLGLNAAEVDVVSQGARRRLTEARSELQLRKKQSTH